MLVEGYILDLERYSVQVHRRSGGSLLAVSHWNIDVGQPPCLTLLNRNLGKCGMSGVNHATADSFRKMVRGKASGNHLGRRLGLSRPLDI
jgi:hypothetical protein